MNKKDYEVVEVIERYERGGGSTYSVDGGKTWHNKEWFEKKRLIRMIQSAKNKEIK